MADIKYNEHENSQAAKILIPLLDALHWNGNQNKIMQSMVNQEETMNENELIDTMANLNYKHFHMGHVKIKDIDERNLPLMLISGENFYVILNKNDDSAMVFEGESGTYKNISVKNLHGEVYGFTYASELSDSLIHEQNHWFSKLLARFKGSLKSLIVISLLLALLDLLIPLFVILIYDQIGSYQELKSLLILLAGVFLYFFSSMLLEAYRHRITNYVSVRTGSIISGQTFRKLMYLPPSYMETASVSAQINRVKDFENLKNFVKSGLFINVLDLVFSIVYIVAIFLLAGWIGVIPIITFLLVFVFGMIMRPYNKNNVDSLKNAKAEQNRSLLEILKNTREIKYSGMKDHWLDRHKELEGSSILKNYEQGKFVATTNNVIFFITNVSVLFLIYGGVQQVFEGKLSMGGLIGIILLYWKILASIRSSSSFLVQMNGLTRSIEQINRFMKLPQDTSLKENMLLTKDIKGEIDFQDVSIRYSKTTKAALINVNFHLEPGHILGLTGHDGAGKSTILKTILGMYIPQGGRILIDKSNLKQLEPLSLRQNISYAPERDVLLEGTIRSNFKCINPSIGDEEILKIISKTDLKTYFERFNFNLDTKLTKTMLAEISPSFKKMFCITRLLARDVKLYLIDEPENHLNHEELEKISHLFQSIAKEKGATVILVSKSEMILRGCNQVIKLNQGRVIK